MDNSNICILILSTKSEKYRGFITAIENSWYKEAISRGFKVYFYSGSHSEDCIYSHNEIRVRECDSIRNSYRKFISSKNVLIKKFPDVKLVYRTNLSTYIDIDCFTRYILNSSFSDLSYHGFKGTANLVSEKYYNNKFLHLFFKYLNIGPEINFFSGAGFFIGIELCNTLSLDNSKKYLIDDVEIGRQILNFRSHNVKYERVYITDSYIKIAKDELDSLVKDSNLFHYKFKTSNRNVDMENIAKFSDIEFRNDFLTI